MSEKRDEGWRGMAYYQDQALNREAMALAKVWLFILLACVLAVILERGL